MSLHTSTKVVVYIGGHLCLFSVTAAAKHFFQLFRTHLHFSSSQQNLGHFATALVLYIASYISEAHF